MALRLAFHLALNIDMTPYVRKGSLSVEEAELRRTVFWSTYTADHLWGFYLGRPFRTSMEDVTVARPREGPNREATDQWIPYTTPEALESATPLLDHKHELSRQRILMCDIMASLGCVLYGNRTMSGHLLQEVNAKTVSELISWKENLPPALQIDLHNQDALYLPHVLVLHMQYYQNMIHAHRPWMSRTTTQPQPPQGPGSSHARMTCIESAAATGNLLQLYERLYTFSRMNIHAVGITCSAASILIFASVTNHPGLSPEDAARHLSACFRALDCFSSSWETAKKARAFLAMLQRKWELKARHGGTGHDLQSKGLHKKRARTLSRGSMARPTHKSRTSPPLQDTLGQGARQRHHSANIDPGVDFDWMLSDDLFAMR